MFRTLFLGEMVIVASSGEQTEMRHILKMFESVEIKSYSIT
jgi:hypothetical protein